METNTDTVCSIIEKGAKSYEIVQKTVVIYAKDFRKAFPDKKKKCELNMNDSLIYNPRLYFICLFYWSLVLFLYFLEQYLFLRHK